MTQLTNISRLDDIGTMYVTINENFDEVETAINALEDVVDTTNGLITINNLTVAKGANVALSTFISTIEASQKVKGNFEVESTSTLSDIDIIANSTITLNSSALNLEGVDSAFSNEGSTSLSGMVVLPNYGESFVDAANVDAYTTNTGNVGTYVIGNKNAIVFDFANYSSSEDVENIYTVKDIIIEEGTTVGQSATLVVNASSSTGKPHRIKSTNIISMTSGTHINCNDDYCVIDLVWLASGWLIKNLYRANIS